MIPYIKYALHTESLMLLFVALDTRDPRSKPGDRQAPV